MGRSNVGKSSLINALVRQRIARTSARPGKTRLANIYRVRRGETAAPFYLVDLPGYGYVQGGSADFARLVGEYFGARGHARGREREARSAREASQGGVPSEAAALGGSCGGGAPRAGKKSGPLAPVKTVGALLLVDARHPGLESDRTAWQWIQTAAESAAIVAAKIDKLTRGERNRALRAIESVFEHPVLPVSAATGEGLEELWKLIDRLANSRNPQRRRNSRPRKTTAPSPPRK